MKNLFLPLLTCLSAVVLLSGCGGGGAAGGGASSPISLLPPSVNDPSPLPAQVAGPRGALTTYVGNPGGRSISSDALYNYYSGIYGANHRVTDPNSQFLLVRTNIDEVGDYSNYYTIRNSSNRAAPPYLVRYRLESSRSAAFVFEVFRPGARLGVGQSFVITLGSANLVTVEILNSGLDLGGSTLTLSSGYAAGVYGTSASVTSYSFFLNAEYSALYLDVDPSPPNDDALDSHTLGALTDYGDLPATGVLTYNIHHAVGSYADGQTGSGSRLLSGSGTLAADFGSRMVTLNLEVFDHSGSLFMDVNDVRMAVDPDRNQFHCASAGPSSCAGGFDYASGVRLQDNADLGTAPANDRYYVKGSFYGPNAEEVAGGIYHENSSTRTEMELVFIGRR